VNPASVWDCCWSMIRSASCWCLESISPEVSAWSIVGGKLDLLETLLGFTGVYSAGLALATYSIASRRTQVEVRRFAISQLPPKLTMAARNAIEKLQVA